MGPTPKQAFVVDLERQHGARLRRLFARRLCDRAIDVADRHESSVGWPPMCSAAAIAGYPSLTVPAGMVDGLPVGIAFVARRFAEETLLRVGRRFELAREGRQPPDLR